MGNPVTTVQREGRNASRFLAWFGILFTVIPLLILTLSVIPTLYKGWQVRGWQPVHAELLSANLETVTGDAVTYKVTARYRYHWQGVAYVASRVGINGGADNIGDWQQRTYSRLMASRQLTAWIDPEAPSEAVLDREIRWGLLAFKMIFVVIFGGVGLAIIYAGVRMRRPRHHAATVPSTTHAPQAHAIRPEGRSELMVLWILTTVLLGGSALLLFHRDAWLRSEIGPHMLLWLFPLMALLLLLQASIKTLRWQRFGGARLNLDPFPGAAGGKVAGTIKLPRISEQIPVRLRLSCLHVYWPRSGRNREKREEIVWQDERVLRMMPGYDGERIEFSFNPPSGLPASSTGNDYHRWVVAVEAEIAGPDLGLRFEIPVVQTTVSHEAGAAAIAPEQPPVVSGQLPGWLQVDYQGGALQITLPVLRNRAVDVPITVFGVVFAAIGIVLMRYSSAPFVLALVFALMGGLFALLGLYSLGQSLRVRISPQGVELLRRVYGLAIHRRFDAAQLRHIGSRIGSQAGQRAYYNVVLELQNGRRVTVADSLPGAAAAEELITMIRSQLKRELVTMPAPAATPLRPHRQEEPTTRHWANYLAPLLFLLVMAKFIYEFMQ